MPIAPAAGRGALLTDRQQQVFRQVARGLTNKEIAFALGITERGVAAQVSRLLAKFIVPNRAALIARVMSNALERDARLPDPAADPLQLTPEMARACAAYQHSAFMVALTLGPDNLIAFVNDACKRRMGIGVESPDSATFEARRDNPASGVFVDGSKDAFRTGLPQSVEFAATRWLRDDGTWGSGALSCVLQPVGQPRAVSGVLWICSTLAN
ncbi:MAG: Bacterial regulatory protein luxR family [Chloroflexota bacterium]|jgi:DNA-binding CsgD family transcriptional regulator|nr:Bacterial regulatory protein luxR family [Chloroflexota bacterium]